MTVANVVKIAGSPGAGKTYTLKQYLREEADAGVTATDMWWLNFTNSGREDVIPELEETYPNAEEPDERAKTFHGLALSLGLRDGIIEDVNEQLIIHGKDNDGRPFESFCKKEGLTYDPQKADPSRLLKPGESTDKTGNQLFAINEYLSQTAKPPEKWPSAPVNPSLPGGTVLQLLKRWEEYKREAFDKRKFEHSDYINAVFESRLQPAATVLMIDEFQDLAPAEYRLFKLWRDYGPVERIYIAGDPNQSIYSFRGASPYYFENTDTDTSEILNQSYRCPAEIADLGNRILSAHPLTDSRGFEGKSAGGDVNWLTKRSMDLREGVFEAVESHGTHPSVMLLVRFRRQLRGLMKDLNAKGIPYTLLGAGRGVWEGDLQEMLGFLNSWKTNAKAYPWGWVDVTLEHLPETQERAARWVGGDKKLQDRESVKPAFEGFDSAESIIKQLQIDAWKRDMLKNAVEAPAYLQPPHIHIGTIHAAKGLEAPVVYLFADSSKKQVERYGNNTDTAAEEHRVYYVGATRASEKLRIVTDYFTGPTAPPIRRARPGAIA